MRRYPSALVFEKCHSDLIFTPDFEIGYKIHGKAFWDLRALGTGLCTEACVHPAPHALTETSANIASLFSCHLAH